MRYFKDITERIVYNQKKTTYKNKKIHMGQLKLLINEIIFLDQCVKIHEKKNMQFNLLYIGSGKGFHIPLLIDMFSEYKINWFLFDPNKHCDKLYDLQNSIKNLTITDDLFTPEDIENYKFKENLLLISDFRQSAGESPTEDEILSDIKLQNMFLKELNPLFSHIKFRIPFPSKKNISFEKPIGLEILQAFVKHDSCEYRIFLTKNIMYEKIKGNDVLYEYEEKFNWYNTMYRQQKNNDYEIAYDALSSYYKNNVKTKIIEKNDIFNHVMFLNNSIWSTK